MIHVFASTGLAHDHWWAMFPIVFGLIGAVVGGAGTAAHFASKREED